MTFICDDFSFLLDLLKFLWCTPACQSADMVKLADTPDLGSGAERRKSSSLFIRTIVIINF